MSSAEQKSVRNFLVIMWVLFGLLGVVVVGSGASRGFGGMFVLFPSIATLILWAPQKGSPFKRVAYGTIGFLGMQFVGAAIVGFLGGLFLLS